MAPCTTFGRGAALVSMLAEFVRRRPFGLCAHGIFLRCPSSRVCWQPDALSSAEFRFSCATPDVMFRLLYLPPFAGPTFRRHRCLLSLASFTSQRALHRTILMFVFHWCVSVLCTRKIKDTQCGESRQPAYVFIVFSFSPFFCWSRFFLLPELLRRGALPRGGILPAGTLNRG